MNRAERRRLTTHARLLDAVRELLQESSVDALVVHDVTERADVALGTFYNHFEDKMSAVTAVAAVEAAAGRRAVLAMAPADGLTPARGAALAVAALIHQFEIEPRAMRTLCALFDARVLPDEASVDLVRSLMVGAGRSLDHLAEWHLAAFRGALVALVDFLAHRGFCCSTERAIRATVPSVLGASCVSPALISDAVEVAVSAPRVWKRVPTAELLAIDADMRLLAHA